MNTIIRAGREASTPTTARGGRPMVLPAGLSEYDDVAVPGMAWGSTHHYHQPAGETTSCGEPMDRMLHPLVAAGRCADRCNTPCPDCWPPVNPWAALPVGASDTRLLERLHG